jgi:dephospho-CoA kinase
MKTKIIGLTGGIGSGKTTVARKLVELGIPVYFADLEAKKLMNQPFLAEQIQSKFGPEVYDQGVLQNQILAAKVFSDPNNIAQLNAIVHPAVAQDFQAWLIRHQEYKLVVKEVAILFETGGEKNCDYVVLVTAPLETRIQRVMQRDGVTRKQVLDRINLQWNDEIKRKLSDFVIENDSKEHLNNNLKKTIDFLNNI